MKNPDIEKVKVIEMEEFDANGFAEKRKEYQKIFKIGMARESQPFPKIFQRAGQVIDWQDVESERNLPFPGDLP